MDIITAMAMKDMGQETLNSKQVIIVSKETLQQQSHVAEMSLIVRPDNAGKNMDTKDTNCSQIYHWKTHKTETNQKTLNPTREYQG